MKQFLRRINPKRAAVDLVEVWQQPNEHRWPVLGVAVAATFALFMLFIPESQRVEPRPPDVTYIATYDETRTREQIILSNCENEIRQQQREELLARREELRRDMYMALGRATGMDVDAINEEAQAERAAAEAEIAVIDAVLDPSLSFEELCGSGEG